MKKGMLEKIFTIIGLAVICAMLLVPGLGSVLMIFITMNFLMERGWGFIPVMTASLIAAALQACLSVAIYQHFGFFNK